MQMRIRQQKSKRTAQHKLCTDIGLRIYWCRRKTAGLTEQNRSKLTSMLGCSEDWSSRSSGVVGLVFLAHRRANAVLSTLIFRLAVGCTYKLRTQPQALVFNCRPTCSLRIGKRDRSTVQHIVYTVRLQQQQ